MYVSHQVHTLCAHKYISLYTCIWSIGGRDKRTHIHTYMHTCTYISLVLPRCLCVGVYVCCDLSSQVLSCKAWKTACTLNQRRALKREGRHVRAVHANTALRCKSVSHARIQTTPCYEASSTDHPSILMLAVMHAEMPGRQASHHVKQILLRLVNKRCV